MSFSIQDYKKFYLFLPCIFLLSLLCFDGFQIYFTIRACLLNQSCSFHISSILCSLPLAIISIVILTRRIHLFYEKTEDMQHITGEIQEIQKRYIAPDPINRSNPWRRLQNGELHLEGYIVINNHTFLCLNVEQLVCGKSVMIGYLPKSKCVLYYDYV